LIKENNLQNELLEFIIKNNMFLSQVEIPN